MTTNPLSLETALPAAEILQPIEAELASAKTLLHDDRHASQAHIARALELAQELTNAGYDLSAQMLAALQIQAELQSLAARHDRALELGTQALALAQERNDTANQVYALDTMSRAWRLLGDYATGLEVALRALHLSKETADPIAHARALKTVAMFHDLLGDHTSALEAYNDSLTEFKQAGSMSNAAAVLNNLAMTHLTMKIERAALEAARAALHLARECQSHMTTAMALTTLGDIYLSVHDSPRALDFFQQARTEGRAYGHAYVEGYSLLNIGRIFILQERGADAIPVLQEALRHATQAQLATETFEAHQALAEAYQQCADFKSALEHFQKFHALKEAVFNDTTDQRLRNLQIIHRTAAAQQEREIFRLKNVELEREIAARVQAERALNERAAELERQNAELDSFAATVAHDLKSPLSAILAYAQFVNEGAGFSKAQEQEFLQRILWGARKMNDIINHLLLLARLRQTETLPLHVVDMSSIVQDAWQRVTLSDAQSSAALILPSQWLPVLGSPLWLEEVWANLLSNAIKYGGQPPRIEIGCARQADNRVQFWIHDNGEGILPEQQAQIFEPFERLHKHRHQEGHGLGLPIVRRVIEKLGGEVGVTSVIGKGSTFYFCLPAA